MNGKNVQFPKSFTRNIVSLASSSLTPTGFDIPIAKVFPHDNQRLAAVALTMPVCTLGMGMAKRLDDE